MSSLQVKVAATTDYWRKPPVIDVSDAPISAARTLLSTDFHRARVTVSAPWTRLYDQGGLLVFLPTSVGNTFGKIEPTKRCWLKAGIELCGGRPNLSAVAAREWADWSLNPLSGDSVTIEIAREPVDSEKGLGSSLLVYTVENGERSLLPVREVTWAFEHEGEITVDGALWDSVVFKNAEHAQSCLVPSQRSFKGHLPSYSGDFAGEMHSRRKSSTVGRPGISLKTPFSESDASKDYDDESKSSLTVLRVWLANILPPFGSSVRLRNKNKAALKRRKNFILLLLSSACALFFWTHLRSPAKVRENSLFTQTEIPEPSRQNVRAAPHVYRPDGLLEVNPNGTHPIFDLITKAESAWARKLRRASATFQEAIEEYVRRYHRPPPKGFDKWWEYVQENKVQLPDEYDVIHDRLEPFWGIRPSDIRRVMADWEDHSDIPVMVFGKSEGRPIRILKNGMPEAEATTFAQGLRQRLNFLLDIEENLPDFRAIISPGDTPNLLADYELLEEAREAARKGTFIDVDAPPPMKHGWISACKPDSPARKRVLDFYAPVPVDLLRKKKKTFVHDHVKSMDPCNHPAHLFINGQFLSHYEGPSPHRVLVPQFSSSTTLLHYDVLPIPPPGWGEERRDIAWERKYDERLQWRGLNTGMICTPNTRWRQSQRFRLVDLTSSVEGDVTVLRPPRQGEELNQVGEGEKWSKARINPAMLDIAFSGNPVQCEGETCEELRAKFDWRKRMDTEESSRYKYIIDVDGNGWSSRFKRLMGSNSLIFKSTVYPEWFADRIQPWVHYIPISIDYSDLYDAFVFFRGDITGSGNHDELAKRIALAGSKWTDTFWRDEDATAYMYRSVPSFFTINGA
ncbi:hypothetical protein EW145_g7761 [Phellinidium pouzarii]|uniref:Glycosyl transferase CAP10 domain-containing protein n=1 Tax=Phellinidium pouzarii TaxID=167371 RepID=A0A4S4KIU5_9AGAM|nr:hypothetical protein EW145_g7761 [Phellinidium pouzarii]